jgi:ankyrin repeat protein
LFALGSRYRILILEPSVAVLIADMMPVKNKTFVLAVGIAGMLAFIALCLTLHHEWSNLYWKNQLVRAIKSNSVVKVKNALDHKPDLKGVDASGDTILMLATQQNSLPIVEMLLQHGAPVNVRRQYNFVEDGNTPLIICCRNQNVKIAKLLIEHGANINLRGGMNITPLMVAVRYSDLSLVRLLLINGAQVAARDDRGFTAYTMMQRNNKNATKIWHLLKVYEKEHTKNEGSGCLRRRTPAGA